MCCIYPQHADGACGWFLQILRPQTKRAATRAALAHGMSRDGNYSTEALRARRFDLVATGSAAGVSPALAVLNRFQVTVTLAPTLARG